MTQHQEIIFEEINGIGGKVGSILLNRPQALNALSQNMCEQLGEQLNTWQKNTEIKAVIIKGEGDRAFCAGGDIRSMYADRDKDKTQPHPFFAIEYQMNARLHHFNKPYIALMDGIAMGGGLGVSIHGSHRVATERSKLAMPETGIGLFPDIGAGYFLSRCPGKIGLYLGLTGNIVNAADAYQFGLITHILPHDRLEELERTLIETNFGVDNINVINTIIDRLHVPMNNTQIWPHRDLIDRCFAHDSVESIIEALKQESDELANQTVEILLSRSPTSLKVTLQHLTLSANESFDQIISRDYHLAQNFLRHHDFYEGIRAALIDKDKSPQWQPATLDDVSPELVEDFFQPKENRLALD